MKKLSGRFDLNMLLRNRKMRPILLALVFTLAFCVFVTATLFAGSSYVPEDNVQEMNYERSQVYVDGTGYVLEDYTKKQHEEEEEQRTIIKEEENPEEEEDDEPTYTPPTYRRNYSSTPSYSRPSYYRPSYTPPRRTTPSNNTNNNKKKKEKKEKTSKYDKEKEEVDVKPTITISGIKKGDTVNGTTKKFSVTATSYDGDEITGSQLTVRMNGVKLTASGESYVGDVIDGDNKIEVKAVDGEGYTNTKTVKFKGVTEKEPEIIGDLNVLVTAEALGIDVIVDESTVDIYDNDQLSDVVKRYFKEGSVSTDNIGGGDHYELGRIKIKGILKDIPEDILEELEEKGISVPDDKDSLGLNDFGPGSGWMYKVNGSAPNKYMDKVDPKDGSTVEIYYTISGMD